MTLAELALLVALWAVWVLAIVVLLRGFAELRRWPPPATRTDDTARPRSDYTDMPLRSIGSGRTAAR